MFDDFKRDRKVRKALRLIANQRAIIQFDGEVYAVENSPAHLGWFRVAVTTALFRGWAELAFDAIPTAVLRKNGDGDYFSPRLEDLKPHYRLTEGGWATLHRTHGWTVATFFVSLWAFVASVIAVIVAWPK